MLGSWLLLYPLWHHANLQVLHLLPATPLLPAAAAFVPFSAASPLALPRLSAGTGAGMVAGGRARWWWWLAGQTLSSNFVLSFVLQSVYATLQHGLYHRTLLLLPAPCNGGSIPASLVYDDGDGHHGPGGAGDEGRGDRGGSGTEPGAWRFDGDVATATISIDPRTGEFSSPVHAPTADPLELADPPLPPSPDQHPRDRARDHARDRARDGSRPHRQRREEGGGQQSSSRSSSSNGSNGSSRSSSSSSRRPGFRDTTLSAHPVDIAAWHAADCLSNALLLASESAMLRRLARSRVGPGSAVYAPTELRGRGMALVVKALVVGEWGLLWALFESSLLASSVVGVRWFGYSRRV